MQNEVRNGEIGQGVSQAEVLLYRNIRPGNRVHSLPKLFGEIILFIIFMFLAHFFFQEVVFLLLTQKSILFNKGLCRIHTKCFSHFFILAYNFIEQKLLYLNKAFFKTLFQNKFRFTENLQRLHRIPVYTLPIFPLMSFYCFRIQFWILYFISSRFDFSFKLYSFFYNSQSQECSISTPKLVNHSIIIVFPSHLKHQLIL